VKLLVDKRADIEAAGDDMTALSIAASLGLEGGYHTALGSGGYRGQKR
jgi:hypothetical protein